MSYCGTVSSSCDVFWMREKLSTATGFYLSNQSLFKTASGLMQFLKYLHVAGRLFSRKERKMWRSTAEYIGGSGACLHQIPCGSSPTETICLLDSFSNKSIQHTIFSFIIN